MCRLLKEWRVQSNQTQRSLADRLRKPHSYVWKVEAGERRIDPIEFIAWCHACAKAPAAAIEHLE
jgi:transcriptional regulator with XRE-family HTH domain